MLALCSYSWDWKQDAQQGIGLVSRDGGSYRRLLGMAVLYGMLLPSAPLPGSVSEAACKLWISYRSVTQAASI